MKTGNQLRSKPRTLNVLPDGTAYSDRAVQKVRRREQGWQYASAQLVRFGASPLAEGEDACLWLARWVPLLTRPLRHPGNHRYAWLLRGRALPGLASYPKKGLR